MHLADLLQRETGIGRKLASNSLHYGWLLARFTTWQKDTHLVQGDINASPDVESVAGTVVKFCEDVSNCQVVALADEDGILYIFNTSVRGPKSLVSKWSVHKNAIFDLEWLPHVPRLVTASGHQIASLVDVTTLQTIDTFKGHSSSLKTIASRRSDPYVFATGGRDGSICIWDQRVARRGNLIPTCNEIKQAHAFGSRHTRKSTSQSITGLCFQDETTLVSCASNDSVIKVWDLRRSYKTHKNDPMARHKFSYHGKSLKQVGYSGLTMDHSRSFVYANCIDDHIYKFSAISYQDQVVGSYGGHKNKTFFVKSALSPDDRFLVTGSSDQHARIYNVSGQGSSAAYELKGHTDEVTSVAWSTHEIGKIATISDDDTLRIWRLGESFTDDVIVGSCSRQQSVSEAGLTRIRSRACRSCVSGSNKTSASSSAGSGVRPWPILKGLDIQPKLSSPRKLLISPRKSAGVSSLGGLSSLGGPASASATAGPSNPVNQAKRKLVDCDYFYRSPSKRMRDELLGVTSLQKSPGLTSTLSPIRINNSSKVIVNITPTAARECFTDFSSPTANLPNSVLDPQTPKRQNKENAAGGSGRNKSGSDWLSQLSKEKQEKFSSPSVISSTITPSRTNQQRARNSTSKTPTSSKKVAQTLMKYFSPTTQGARGVDKD